MLILAFESSAKPASVAVCSDGELIGQYFQNSGLTHSRTLLVMVEALLKNLDLVPTDIGVVAVARGPGSFTGVRIGVSAAKGLAWGLDIPVSGVSTLEAMAWQVYGSGITPAPGAALPICAMPAAGSAPVSCPVICAVMDARRGQVYNALFEWKDGGPSRLCPDRAVSLEDLSAELKCGAAPCLLAGDGAAISYDFLTNAGVNCMLPPALLRWQTAYGVAMAALNAERIPPAQLEPSYLRPSQAERERSEKA